MHKNKFRSTILNVLIIMAIIVCLYYTKNLWSDIYSKVLSIITPFVIAFLLSVILLPMKTLLVTRWKIRSSIAKPITAVLAISLLFLLIALLIPLSISTVQGAVPQITKIYQGQLHGLFEKFHINPVQLVSKIDFSSIIQSFVTFGSTTLITLIVFLFTFFEIEKIVAWVKTIIQNYTSKWFKEYAALFEDNLNNYAKSIAKYIFVAMAFYTVLILAINIVLHINIPWYFGMLYGILIIIPYVGPLLATLLIGLSILSQPIQIIVIVLGIVALANVIEGNSIQMKFVGQQINTHPLLVVFSIIVSSAIFGTAGIFLTPIMIVVIKSIVDLVLQIDIVEKRAKQVDKVVSQEEKQEEEFINEEE